MECVFQILEYDNLIHVMCSTFSWHRFLDSGQVQEDEVVDSNVLQYCSLDKKEKKSVGEMEQDFLQALQVTYNYSSCVQVNLAPIH